jgi:hypothetical protein
VKALNGIPIVTTFGQGLKHFIAIELPVWQQIHQVEHEASPGALALRVYGVAMQAGVQDDMAEWPNVVVTGINYRSPQTGSYQFPEGSFIHYALATQASL